MSRRTSPHELHREVGSAASILVFSSSGPGCAKVLCLGSPSALQSIIFSFVPCTERTVNISLGGKRVSGGYALTGSYLVYRDNVC